jgi:alanine racemase
MTAPLAEASLTIDLDALAANHACVSKEAAGAATAPVVKGDGYGLGAAPVAKRLWSEGARTFFVARLSEGEALRAALGSRQAEILVLDGATPGTQPRLAAAGLTPVLSTAEQAAYWRRADGRPAALHVDTGMHRLGVSLDEAEALARSGLPVSLLMSHLGCAAEPAHPRNAAQLQRFRVARALFPGAPASLAASAGAFLGPDYRFDMVRPGVSLYGGGPEERPDPRLAAVATLHAPILQIHDLRPGDSVGYGTMFTAARPMRVAVLGGGYADGVLRTSHAQGAGWIEGAAAPFLIVSMDMIVVDLTGAPQAKAGDRVELLGPHAQLDDLAKAASSVAHEILVRISPRAHRRYVGDPG